MNYNIEGVLYDANIKYEGLIITISSILGVDTTIFHLELKYVVSGPSPPTKIHNCRTLFRTSRISSQHNMAATLIFGKLFVLC